MISLFNYSDYRNFLVDFLALMPRRGYGQSRKIAEFLGVHTTLVSQVLKKKKSFTMEQAAAIAEYFAFNEMETDYFSLLVQLERAGTQRLRKNVERQREKLKSQAKELVNRLQANAKLSEGDRAIFYSDWTFTAIRQIMLIKGFQDLETIAQHFGLSRKRAREIVDFLLQVGLSKETSSGLQIGPAMTHVESNSPWVRLHHMNWRQKAIEALNGEGHAKLHYTAPLTLSRADAEVVREMIAKLLESVDRVVEPSPSETLRCLNVDWFEITGA